MSDSVEVQAQQTAPAGEIAGPKTPHAQEFQENGGVPRTFLEQQAQKNPQTTESPPVQPEPFANPLLDFEDPDRATLDRKDAGMMTDEERQLSEEKLTKEKVEKIVKGLTESQSASNKVTGELVQDMMTEKGTSPRNIADLMRRNEFHMEIVPYLLQKPEIIELMDVMLDDVKAYRTPLALMLSQVPFSELPISLQEKIHPSPEIADASVKTEHEGWALCSKTEGYMDWAMSDDSVTLVDDMLLAKARGRITALCMETRKTADDHVLLEGVFYSPADKESRDQIRDNMSNGVMRTTTEGSSWVVMRGLHNDKRRFIHGERTLENAKEYIKDMPEKASETVPFMDQFKISRAEFVRISSSNPYDFGEGGESAVKWSKDDLRDKLYAENGIKL